MKIEKNVKFPLNNMVNWQEIEKNAKFLLNNMESCYQGLKYALSGRLKIHPCVLQDIGPLGPLPCSHSNFLTNHSKQGIGYRWPSAILGWLVTNVCVWSGVWDVDGGWMPLPTRAQRYCDPASLVLNAIVWPWRVFALPSTFDAIFDFSLNGIFEWNIYWQSWGDYSFN